MEIIEQIGSYAGLAAVVGLAVLSALYFSQARDVKRLRDWAGRAPERTVQQVTPVPGARPAAPTGAKPAVGPAKPVPKKAPAPATPAAANQQPRPAPAGPRTPAPAPAPVGAQASAPAAAGAKPATAAQGRVQGAPAAAPTPRPPIPPRPGTQGGAQARPGAPSHTEVMPPWGEEQRPPWYRRLVRSPRYIVLLVVGLLVVGGGAAFGVVRLTAEDEPASTQRAGDGGSDERRGGRGGPAIDPSTVTVSVLNGTTIPGLAAQIGDKIEAERFELGNVTNSTDQRRAESVILFAPGAEREAVAVGRKLKIDQREPINPESQALGGDATVVVVVGADQTQ
jgi:hypothetical protein